MLAWKANHCIHSHWRTPMNYPEQGTCAHIPCSCVVSPGEKYCSESCEDAGSEEVEIACECGHATCSVAAAEEDVA
jgi:hypothetical protein